ncbi:MAG: 50S ribosomal protein L6 [Candidatus Doudnabacteria bacterium]|jgi:large subunit ribosomal protein L6
MSRIGKKPVVLPSGVKAEKKDLTLTVTGPKGSLTLAINPKVEVAVSATEILVDVKNKNNKSEKALWGLFRALIQNLVDGVTKGFEKKLEVIGVGFKVALQGTKIVMALGFSHPVEVEIPKGIVVTVDKNTISISGPDKQQVGQFAAEIRELKKPEPYKGKGIKYSDEVIIRKAGKVVKVVGGGK